MMNNNRIKYWLSALVIVFTSHILFAQSKELVSDLTGDWKFSIGDDMKWMQMNYDDKDWDAIWVPSAWEYQGYHGYDGYAWYRKKVYIPGKYISKQLLLKLGRIDDVDEVYFNGKLVGRTGSFPPNYVSAYSVYRDYNVPNTIVRYNDWNLIAVRVFDSEQVGGMLDGEFSLYAMNNILFPMMSLESEWKFKTGDNSEWKNPRFDDSKWGNIMVPGKWENLGYPNYDGYAWYRKKFVPFNSLKGSKLVLMLGKIDDYDEVFINGVKIGGTGKIDRGSIGNNDKTYSQFRGYFVPDGLLKFNDENVIAVRVFDGWRDGGIYEGPVGFTTQQRYIQFWRQEKKNNKSFIEKFFFGDD